MFILIKEGLAYSTVSGAACSKFSECLRSQYIFVFYAQCISIYVPLKCIVHKKNKISSSLGTFKWLNYIFRPKKNSKKNFWFRAPPSHAWFTLSDAISTDKNFGRKNFSAEKNFGRQNFRHQLEISAVLSDANFSSVSYFPIQLTRIICFNKSFMIRSWFWRYFGCPIRYGKKVPSFPSWFSMISLSGRKKIPQRRSLVIRYQVDFTTFIKNSAFFLSTYYEEKQK